MEETYYVGLDVHKKTVSYCVKRANGETVREGRVAARRADLENWAAGMPGPWVGTMEATMFTGWIYDCLKPRAEELKVAHPAMLKALAAGKHKDDRGDAEKMADLTRCDLVPEVWMAPPRIRELRRVLRYRNLLMGQAVQLKCRIASLLMETGTEYDANRLHGARYFAELVDGLADVPESVTELLKMSRRGLETLGWMDRSLLRGLERIPGLRERTLLLQTIPAVGRITALTWALEIGDPHRFSSIGKAVSYCGLCAGRNSSAGKERRGSISKQRNPHLQTVLVESAKLAPRWSPRLAEVYQRARLRGDHNRATLEVARKLVAWLMAVDRSGRPFRHPA